MKQPLNLKDPGAIYEKIIGNSDINNSLSHKFVGWGCTIIGAKGFINRFILFSPGLKHFNELTYSLI
jgi:hypothetical protein